MWNICQIVDSNKLLDICRECPRCIDNGRLKFISYFPQYRMVSDIRYLLSTLYGNDVFTMELGYKTYNLVIIDMKLATWLIDMVGSEYVGA